MLGQGWQFQWTRVHRRLDDVRAVYTGREGGTEDALDTTLSFFEAIHHLKDWLRNDQSSGITKPDGGRADQQKPDAPTLRRPCQRLQASPA